MKKLLKNTTTMKKGILSFFTVILFFTTHQGFSQLIDQGFRPAENLLPKSPEAAMLFKFQDIPVSKYTGIADISIPLMDISQKNMGVGVDLSYHASGHKVSDVATSVGLGWKLNAGGMISRKVNGLEDDAWPGVGFLDFRTQRTYAEVQSWITEEKQTESANLAMGCNDPQPDEFYFNFNGYNGKFAFDWSGNPVIVSEHNIKFISFQRNTGVSKEITEWKFADPLGYIYTFSQKEWTVIYNEFSYQSPCQSGNHSYITSWYLTQIESPYNSNDNIIFTYQSVTLQQGWTGFETRSYKMIYSTACDGFNTGSSSFSSSRVDVDMVQLKKITAASGNNVEFYYNTARTDVNTDFAGSPTVYRLDQIKLKTSSGTILKAYNLNYGSSGRLKLSSVTETNSSGALLNPYEFKYNNTSLPSDIESRQVDHWGFYNGSLGQTLLPKYIHRLPWSTNGIAYFEGNDRESYFNYSVAEVLTKVKYPTKGETEFTYELNDYGYIGSQSLESQQQYQANWATIGFVDVSGNTSNSNWEYATPKTIIIPALQQCYIEIYSNFYSWALPVGGGSQLPQVWIEDAAGNVVYSKLGDPLVTNNNQANNSFFTERLFYPPGTYTLHAKAKKQLGAIGSDYSSISVSGNILNTASLLMEKPTGGVRIKNITVRDENGNIASEKVIEKELAEWCNDLDKSVQDLEASNEELKSSNEELLSMNEELQSANEEMETSREEVQTANEILQKSHTDLENLLDSSQIATVFLDENLMIKSFTPEVKNIYNILDRDIGRSIEHLTHKALQTQSFAEFRKGNTHVTETELTLADGQTYLRRVLPYKTKNGSSKGWVITFSNITEIRKKEGIYHTLADNLPAMVWTLKPSGELVFMNKEGQRYTGLTPSQTSQIDRLNLIHKDQRKSIENQWQNAMNKESFFEDDVQFKAKDGTYRWFHLKVTPVKISTGQVVKWMALAFDIHDKKMETKNVLLEKSLIETERSNFRNLFKQTPEMVCILKGPNHVFEFVNDAHIKALGFDATGLAVREAQPESVEVHGILDDVYRTGITAELKEIPVTLTDRLRYFDLTYAARRDENGNIDGIMVLGMEITDQVLMPREIKKNEDQLRMAVGVSKMGFNDWDIKDQIFISSYQFYKDWDLDPNKKDFTLPHLLSMIVPEDVEKTQALINEAIETKQDYFAQYRVIRRDKSIVWIEARGSVLYDDNGAPLRFFGTAQDVTHRKETEKEILESRIKAEAASNAKTSFLANMSHEIRTPLGAILGFANLLKESEITPEKQSEYLKIIDRNGQALSKIIDDILDLSKVEAGKLELEKIDFKVDDLLRSVLDIFHETARRKNINLYLNMSKNVPAMMTSDPARIRQILVNLVGNAVKFTKEGEIELQVETEEDNGRISNLKFRVRDTGVGMTSEQQERLFNVFSQADNSTTTKYGRSGLGLALSRRLARALGGDVVVEKSIPGKGATFVAMVEAEKSNALPEPISTATEVTTKKTANDIHVLVAEDSPDNQFLIKHILQKEGFHVDLANNGEEAISMIKKNSYDVVLMDMQMPILDGYNATRVLRSDNYTKPIIALTAHAMVEEKNRILEAGCNLHLTKPLDRKMVIESIYNLVKK